MATTARRVGGQEDLLDANLLRDDFGIDQQFVAVGGEAGLARVLRELAAQQGSGPEVAKMRTELASAGRRAGNLVARELRTNAPVYRRRSQRARELGDNRFVPYGPFANNPSGQPPGELKRSIRRRTRTGRTDVFIGSEAGFYIRPLIAGHATPGGGYAEEDTFVWDVRDRVVPQARRLYAEAINGVIQVFNQRWGQLL